MNLFIFNIYHAIKNLRKSALYSFLSIIGLSIGIAVLFMVFIYFYQEKSVDRNFKYHNRIYRLYDAENRSCSLGYELMNVISEHYPQIESNCALERFDGGFILRSNENSIRVETGISTTNEFFDVFDIPVIQKMSDQPFAESKSIILSKKTASLLFNDINPIGQMVDVNGFFSVKVTAVVDDFPENTSLTTDFILNAEDDDLKMSSICNDGDCYFPMSHYLLLAENADEQEFIKHFNQSIHKYQSRVKKFDIQCLNDIYLAPEMEGSGNRTGNASLLKILGFIGLVVFFLSLINYLNFTISLQHSKLKFISIMKLIGAEDIHLFFYYLAESLLVILLSGIFAVMLIFGLKDLIAVVLGQQLQLHVLIKPPFLMAYVAFTAFVVFIISIISTNSILKFKLVNGLNQVINSSKKTQISSVFTIIQFIASTVLLISVFFIYKQLSFIENKGLGFNQENLLKIEIPYKYNNPKPFQTEINHLPFVKSSSYSKGAPGMVHLYMGAENEEKEIMMSCILIDQTFLKTFEIKLREGRNLLPGDFGKSCYYNQTAYKTMGWQNIEGKRFNNGSEDGYDIIGVVNDFNVSSLHKKQEPVCLIFDDFNKADVLSIRLKSGDVGEQLKQIRKIWSKFSEDPFEFSFYNDFIQAKYIKEKRLSLSLTILAIIALILTLMGILGQVIQSTSKRTKEIGIRKVNGASILEIVFMFNKTFIAWMTISLIISIPIAYFVINRWLSTFAYRTEMSWWLFLLSGLLVSVFSLITVSWISWKAARINPVESLRYE